MTLNVKLLKTLCETPAVPGNEGRLREAILKATNGTFDSQQEDAMGNLILCRKSRAKSDTPPLKIMFLCHMDEIGFMVSHIDKEGFIYVQPMGGFDPRNLFSRRVLVCTDKGDFRGVMNPTGKPIHISSPKERDTVPPVSDFYIDLGLGKGSHDVITLGDFVVMDEPFMEIGTKYVSKALDNRVACWLGVELLNALEDAETKHNADIYVGFTSQEEVGLRGALTACFRVQPDIAFGVDTTLSCDTPGIPEKDQVTKNGGGFGLHLKDGSMIAHRGLVAELETLARDNKIPFQRTMLPAGGQDGAAAQKAGVGAITAGVAVGTRYIHTVTEMIDQADLKAARDILIAYAKNN